MSRKTIPVGCEYLVPLGAVSSRVSAMASYFAGRYIFVVQSKRFNVNQIAKTTACCPSLRIQLESQATSVTTQVERAPTSRTADALSKATAAHKLA